MQIVFNGDNLLEMLNSLFCWVLSVVAWRPLKGYLANSADPDQMPQNAASDQGLHFLQIVQPIFSRNI